MSNLTSGVIPVKKGEVVFYKLKGKDYVRSAPNLRKTLSFENSKGYQFLLASIISKTIRRHLDPVIPYPSDIVMQDRLKKEVLEYVKRGCKCSEDWIKCTWMISRFDFSSLYTYENYKWGSKFKIVRKSSRRVNIKVPSFVPAKSLEAPWHTHTIVCKIAMSVCYRKTGASIGSAFTEFTFPYNNVKVPALLIPMILPTPKMSILVTGLAPEFQANHSYALTKEEEDKYFQSAIIHAMGV
jgi:hypothetical protein